MAGMVGRRVVKGACIVGRDRKYKAEWVKQMPVWGVQGSTRQGVCGVVEVWLGKGTPKLAQGQGNMLGARHAAKGSKRVIGNTGCGAQNGKPRGKAAGIQWG